MSIQSEQIEKAQFNPEIKSYLLLVVAFFLIISIAGIPLLIFWFLGIGQYISRRYYESLACTLTTGHLEFKKGFLFKIEKTIPLENIQDITFIENPLLKYFDLRVLKIETAGNSNPQGSDMKLVGIIDSLAFKEKVFNQRDLLKSNAGPEVSEKGITDSQSVELLKEIRDLLADIKNK